METPQILRLNSVRKPAVVDRDPQQDVPAGGINHAIRSDLCLICSSAPISAVIYQAHLAALYLCGAAVLG
jgi:hypothetical protein